MLNQLFSFKITPKKKQKHILVVEIVIAPFVWIIIKSLFFGLAGALLLAYLPNLLKTNPIQPKQIVEQTAQTNPAIPKTLRLKNFKQEVAIREATVSANDWQIYDDSISYLIGSGDMKQGNIILYGHNKKEILGNIIQLGPEDILELTSSMGTKTYVVDQVFQTSRDDLSALKNTGDLLTIYTCSGWFDANRFFVIAKPASSSAYLNN